MVSNIAFDFEDGYDGLFDGGVRNHALIEARLASVAQACEEITNRVGHGGCCLRVAVGHIRCASGAQTDRKSVV